MPVIFNLPTITIPQAFGLSILLTLISPKNLDLNKKDKKEPKYEVELNEKLSKSLEDITSQFNKYTIYIRTIGDWFMLDLDWVVESLKEARNDENWDLIKEIIAYLESRDDFDDDEDWSDHLGNI